jgi:hypothetical protein
MSVGVLFVSIVLVLPVIKSIKTRENHRRQLKPQMKYKYHIGIDPGKNTGYAEYNAETGLLILETVDFWTCYAMMKIRPTRGVLVHIEVPKTKTNWHASKNSTTSVNVGMAYREMILLAEGIERLGFHVKRTFPQGKIDAKRFRTITGYKGRTNEHTRDAGMLAYKAR